MRTRGGEGVKIQAVGRPPTRQRSIIHDKIRQVLRSSLGLLRVGVGRRHDFHPTRRRVGRARAGRVTYGNVACIWLYRGIQPFHGRFRFLRSGGFTYMTSVLGEGSPLEEGIRSI